jgi:hypothetical protein
VTTGRPPRPGPLLVTDGYGFGAAPADGTVLSWPTVEGWLVEARNYWVCTRRADGRPHAIPVWGLWTEGALWFSTDPASLKARNIARAPETVVHLESGDDVCVLDGSARAVLAADLPTGFLDRYDAKYQFRLDLSNPNFGLFVFDPRVALTWRESDLPMSATRWTFS